MAQPHAATVARSAETPTPAIARKHGSQPARQTEHVDIRLAGPEDLEGLARLLWLHAAPEEQAQQPVEAFSVDLCTWWTDHNGSHMAFVALHGSTEVGGMAWLALVPRVPRPGETSRVSADIQSVFVVPELRRRGIGSQLVHAAVDHARSFGATRVTVHSGRRAVTVYERLGFASSGQLLQWPAE